MLYLAGKVQAEEVTSQAEAGKAGGRQEAGGRRKEAGGTRQERQEGGKCKGRLQVTEEPEQVHAQQQCRGRGGGQRLVNRSRHKEAG